MSLRKGDRRTAPKRRERKSGEEIDLNYVIGFLKFIVCMTAGIAALAVCGLLLVAGRPEVVVVYQMVLAVDAVVLAGGWLSIRSLEKKEKRLRESA